MALGMGLLYGPRGGVLSYQRGTPVQCVIPPASTSTHVAEGQNLALTFRQTKSYQVLRSTPGVGLKGVCLSCIPTGVSLIRTGVLFTEGGLLWTGAGDKDEAGMGVPSSKAPDAELKGHAAPLLEDVATSVALPQPLCRWNPHRNPPVSTRNLKP